VPYVNLSATWYYIDMVIYNPKMTLARRQSLLRSPKRILTQMKESDARKTRECTERADSAAGIWSTADLKLSKKP